MIGEVTKRLPMRPCCSSCVVNGLEKHELVGFVERLCLYRSETIRLPCPDALPSRILLPPLSAAQQAAFKPSLRRLIAAFRLLGTKMFGERFGRTSHRPLTSFPGFGSAPSGLGSSQENAFSNAVPDRCEHTSNASVDIAVVAPSRIARPAGDPPPVARPPPSLPVRRTPAANDDYRIHQRGAFSR
jgi:hypothetical protein